MNKLCFALMAFAFCIFTFDFAKAQSPQTISYQAVARNSSGAIIPNQPIGLRFSIRDSSAGGAVLYQETQRVNTNLLGLLNVNIGAGTVQTGVFTNIAWGANPKFLQVEMDIAGGTTFVNMGAQQLMSVPYSLYANTSKKADSSAYSNYSKKSDTALYAANTMPNGTSAGQMMYWNGSAWVNVQPGSNGQTLTFCNGVPQWGPCAANLPSVTIGTQVWSSKNLDVRTYRNGDVIPQVTDPTQWVNLTTGAWCWYNNDSATYGAIYGRLYNWYAVNDPRGLAPAGWHVPTKSEWDKMTKYLDATVDTTCDGCLVGTTIGTQLKNTTGWNGGGNGSNSTGFTSLPGGGRYNNGQFSNVWYSGYWWRATESSLLWAWFFSLSNDNNLVFRGGNLKTCGFSVRVVRD